MLYMGGPEPLREERVKGLEPSTSTLAIASDCLIPHANRPCWSQDWGGG
jgi:hypothetical protein